MTNNPVVDAFDNQPLVFVKDRKYLVNPLTDHEPTTTYELLDATVKALSKLTDFSKANKILGEEDRGGYIAALVAYYNRMSFGMTKWDPVGLEGEQSIDFRCAYAEGSMYIHGIQKGDKVILVEDMVDSGGTIIAMIKLLEKMGVELFDLIVIAEKEDFQGIKRIKEETGRDVKCLLKFTVKHGDRSKVTWVSDILAKLV
jgi:adenine/guanine phosphoribosyltransferase-like PRPP-binding protein